MRASHTMALKGSRQIGVAKSKSVTIWWPFKARVCDLNSAAFLILEEFSKNTTAICKITSQEIEKHGDNNGSYLVFSTWLGVLKMRAEFFKNSARNSYWNSIGKAADLAIDILFFAIWRTGRNLAMDWHWRVHYSTYKCLFHVQYFHRSVVCRSLNLPFHHFSVSGPVQGQNRIFPV